MGVLLVLDLILWMCVSTIIHTMNAGQGTGQSGPVVGNMSENPRCGPVDLDLDLDLQKEKAPRRWRGSPTAAAVQPQAGRRWVRPSVAWRDEGAGSGKALGARM